MKKLIRSAALASMAAFTAGSAGAVTTPNDRYTGVDCRAVSGTWAPTASGNLRSSSNNSSAMCPLRGVKSYDAIDVFVKGNSTAPACVVITAVFNNFTDDGTEFWGFFSHNSRNELNGNTHVWKVTFGYGNWLSMSHKGAVVCSGLPSGAQMTGIEVDYH